MTPRILLIGKNGQVGHDLEQLLPDCGEVVAVDREQLNLAAPEAIGKTIQTIRPQLIVNAAAYTAVDQAESDEANAFAINAQAPGILAEQAKRIGAALIHYSTDYVFDGSKAAPYDEDDLTNPLSAYGRTKLAGERAIRESGAAHLILRTAWIYSTRGKNFLLTILRLAKEREELRVVNDQIGAPTWSRAVAAATVEIISQLPSTGVSISDGEFAGLSGTYHMTAPGVTNWSEFASTILDRTNAALKHRTEPAWLTRALNGKALIARNIVPITTAEYPTPARRPPYSVLSNNRLTGIFGVHLPDWSEQLRQSFDAGVT